MTSLYPLAPLLAVLLLGDASAKGSLARQCQSIGAISLGMPAKAALRHMKGATFTIDTVIEGAETAEARYSVSTGTRTVAGRVVVIALSGKVRHIYFYSDLRDRLPIEECGALAWKESPPGNPGNLSECWVLSPSVELLVNRSGPGMSLSLVNTNFATRSISASEATVVSRRACSKVG
jgi:hypothetical protein